MRNIVSRRWNIGFAVVLIVLGFAHIGVALAGGLDEITGDLILASLVAITYWALAVLLLVFDRWGARLHRSR